MFFQKTNLAQNTLFRIQNSHSYSEFAFIFVFFLIFEISFMDYVNHSDFHYKCVVNHLKEFIFEKKKQFCAPTCIIKSRKQQ